MYLLKYKIPLYACLLSVLISVYSCNKFVSIPPPINQVTSSEVFADDKTALASINGLYYQMMGQGAIFANGTVSIYSGLSADEFYNSSPNPDQDAFLNNAIPADNSTINTFIWQMAYNHIYQANSIIEGLSGNSQVSSATKTQLTGEAKFVRAFCYFYLTNLFGDVPFVSSTNYSVNDTISRIPAGIIYQNIVSDLKDAKSEMSDSYQTSDRTRPNSFAASSLLARVYLYQGYWSDAEKESSLVINSGVYQMEPALNNVFLSNSVEAIWQLAPIAGNFVNTQEGITFIPYSSDIIPSFVITDNLLKSFDSTDQRKVSWLSADTVGSSVYYFPFKYKVSYSDAITEYNMVLRYAEQFLIRSEARARQNILDGARADLNIIRTRAGLPDISTNDQDSVINAIMKERQVELFSEWGHRWLDLKRTNMAGQILGMEKPDWKPTAVLYPIPLTQLHLNLKLVQNPGY